MGLFSRSKLVLASLFIALSVVSTTAKHAPSSKCNVFDLLEDCKESVVDIAGDGTEKSLGELDQFLISECDGMSGLIVAKCLMKYLCVNHGETAVEHVDECVREVCPLARRLPPKLCHKRRLGGKASFFEEAVLVR